MNSLCILTSLDATPQAFAEGIHGVVLYNRQLTLFTHPAVHSPFNQLLHHNVRCYTLRSRWPRLTALTTAIPAQGGASEPVIVASEPVTCEAGLEEIQIRVE